MNETTLDLFEEQWWEDLNMYAIQHELTADYVLQEFVIEGELKDENYLD